MMDYFELVRNLKQDKTLDDDGFLALLSCEDQEISEYLFATAREVAQNRFGNAIYIRGLIEFTNYCKNDCFYCGIRKSNRNGQRYRLNKEEILACCKEGYELGFRTFVMQGGEDPWYTRDRMVDILSSIKGRYPDCAITLSFGEHSRETFHAYKGAGADRYLLRHETADEVHYQKLHPENQKWDTRKKCLFILKEVGFQVGTGFMVGSPYQTSETILKDIRFIEELHPQMLGIGPFLPHHETPFAKQEKGSVGLTLRLISIFRLMRPNALIPSTTALGTIEEGGREEGILAGANVVMPNLSPLEVRKKYLLYDNKISTGEEAAESVALLNKRMERIGYKLVVARGDYKEEI